MIYCKQIPPEYQDSLLFDDEGMGPDYINVTGNRDYISRTSPLFDRVYNALENGELAEALDDIKNGGYYSSFYKNATQAINDLLEPDKARYSTRDIHALKELVNAYTEAGSREALAAFETMYFNTGSEWIIHDEENTPEGPEEVNGYSCYIVADTEEGIKKELAAVAGCAPSDIVMWAFDEFIRVPQYKAV